MKNRQRRQRLVVRVAAVLAFCAPAVGVADHRSAAEEWDEFKLFIEICGTDEDAGLKVLLGGEPWKSALIFAPNGRLIYRLGPHLGDVGSDTVFLESAEPPFEELPLDEFLDRFPEGEYRAWGVTLEGDRLIGTAELTHDLPDGPFITSHQGDQVVELTGENLVVTWDEVTSDYRGGALGSRRAGRIGQQDLSGNLHRHRRRVAKQLGRSCKRPALTDPRTALGRPRPEERDGGQ